MTYETRHRELREAEERTRAGSLGMTAEHVAAFEALSKFDQLTGPLVDDLVAAVRGLGIHFVRERGESWVTLYPDGGPATNWKGAGGYEDDARASGAIERLAAALTALDEAVPR